MLAIFFGFAALGWIAAADRGRRWWIVGALSC
jgi:hypothetical protein